MVFGLDNRIILIYIIMKTLRLTLTALIFALVFTGCMKERGDITEPEVEENVESVNDLVVPGNFDWKTQQTVQVFVQLPQNGELKPLIITNRDRTKRYFKGFPENTSSRTVSTKITIPSYVNELRLIYDGATGPNMAFILNETLMYDFNANKKSTKVVTCDLSGFITYSKGGWGAKAAGNNPGSIRDQYFDQVYPGDFVIGDDDGYTITFESSDDVEKYLPGGGGPKVLTKNYVNPKKKNKLGNLADQIIAARLNRDYSEAGVLGSNSDYHLGELVYNDGPFEGMSVDDFLEIAQTALSNEGLNGYTVEEIKNAAENIINSFLEGNNAGILTCPNDDDNGDGDDDDEGEDDDPFVEVSGTCADGDVIFTIENNGEEDMETSYSYNVTKNGSGIESGSYELDENETIDIVVSGYNTDEFIITVETPREETLTETITGCGEEEDNGGGGDDDDETDEQFQGTLAYEDLWPGKGDYDFNDLVIDYDFEITKNAQEVVQDITATFTVKAFGASYHNGFAFTLPTVTPGDIVSVSGYDVENTTVFNLAGNGTELGQSNATFIVFDDARRIMPQTTGGIGVNTQLEYDYIDPVTITLEIEFADNAITYSDLNIGTFNPFIVVNTVINGTPGVRGLEVHLPDYEPSDLFDASYFGQAEDASNPGAGEYFVTDKNLPWAINIAEGFEWVIEFQDITGAYNHFAEWAQSGGINYPDWYLDETGYRNDNLIYPTQINQ